MHADLSAKQWVYSGRTQAIFIQLRSVRLVFLNRFKTDKADRRAGQMRGIGIKKAFQHCTTRQSNIKQAHEKIIKRPSIHLDCNRYMSQDTHTHGICLNEI